MRLMPVERVNSSNNRNMTSEAVRVIVRCRPMNEREKALKCGVVIKMDVKRAQCNIIKPDEPEAPKNFTFDGCYFMGNTTEEVYNEITYPLVEGVMEGYNGTVFAYGQTGCGKSFTMQGVSEPSNQRGIIPRAFEHIFEYIQTTENTKFLVRSSYLEIYNEEIRDLIAKDTKSRLELKEHPDKGIYVKDLSWHEVQCVGDCNTIMERGWKNRATGATLMNADSSRSHSIFTIQIEMCGKAADEDDSHIRVGKLNLVDLAGSERQSKTGATGDRLKEATKINLSLSALGNVISALVDGKSKHIPYRDSKLTRLLQDSLGGNTKTLMVACISPADNNYEETLSTLRYANRAKNIKNKPKINEDPKDALLRQYQEEIDKLRAMLMGQIPFTEAMISAMSDGSASVSPAGGSRPRSAIREIESPSSTVATAEIEAEKDKLRQEYEMKINELQQQYEQEQINNVKLQENMNKLEQFYNKQLSTLNTDDTTQHHRRNQPDKPADYSKSESAVTGQQRSPMMMMRCEPEPVSTPVSTALSDSSPEDETVTVDKHIPLPQKAVNRTAVTVPVPGQVPVPAPAVSSNTLQTNSGPNSTTMRPVSPSVARKLINVTPSTGNTNIIKQQEEAMKRLQELQKRMVGGEKANDERLKKKRIEKRSYAEKRKCELLEAVDSDNTDVMLRVYDDIHDELKVKNTQLDQSINKLKSAEHEILDLQREFESERTDYLESIRKQSEQILLLNQILERAQPLIRRDSNYSSLDRIQSAAVWDPERQYWLLPEVTLNRTKLPSTGMVQGGRPEYSPQSNGQTYTAAYIDTDNQEDRLLNRLSNSEGSNYFKPKRAMKLLHKNSNLSREPIRQPSPVPSPRALSPSPLTLVDNNNGLERKPIRLEALPQMKSKRKKTKNTMLEQL